MSIQVVCRNGHTLKVKNELAGKSGLCPVCKTPVQVPRLPAGKVSEDAIMNFLGPGGPVPAGPASDAPPAAPKPLPPITERQATPKKTCSRCKQEIPATIHICPHCHRYIATLADF